MLHEFTPSTCLSVYTHFSGEIRLCYTNLPLLLAYPCTRISAVRLDYVARVYHFYLGLLSWAYTPVATHSYEQGLDTSQERTPLLQTRLQKTYIEREIFRTL
jgi:hypothetical protein